MKEKLIKLEEFDVVLNWIPSKKKWHCGHGPFLTGFFGENKHFYADSPDEALDMVFYKLFPKSK